MEAVFADTHYWIAMTDRDDSWHKSAWEAKELLGAVPLVTTDEVLVELLNTYCSRGPRYREMACRCVHCLRRDPNVQIMQQSRESFDLGMIVYSARSDKGYSLVDCISMNTMHRMGITKILTHDRRFAQEGFEVLIS